MSAAAEGLPRNSGALAEALQAQVLLDFGQEMLLVLSRDLHVIHRGMRVLAVETRRGNWLVLPQSDFYFIQQIRTPVLLSTFLKQNAWLPEPFVKYVVYFLYCKGFLEVNGSGVWEPKPAGAPVFAPIRRLEFDAGGRREAWGALDALLGELLIERAHPVELLLRGVPGDAEGLEELLDARLAGAAGRRVRLSLAWDGWDLPPALLVLADRRRMKVILGGSTAPVEGDPGGVAASRAAFSERGIPFRIRIPWDAGRGRDLFWKIVTPYGAGEGAPASGVPEVEFVFSWHRGEWAPGEERGAALAEELLGLLDEVVARGCPPFIWRDVTPIVARLLRFPWSSGAAECSGYAEGAIAADWRGRCYPCGNVIGVERFASAPASGDRLHAPPDVRRPWWFSFFHPCPGVAYRSSGRPEPDPRQRFFHGLIEGLMWRVAENPGRLSAQLGVVPGGRPRTEGGETTDD